MRRCSAPPILAYKIDFRYSLPRSPNERDSYDISLRARNNTDNTTIEAAMME